MNDVTQILSQIESGDPSAAAELLPLVYSELRRLAGAKLADENPGQTLQATALVHEAYLRLVDVDQARRWNSRVHFFRAAAEAMRRILVDHARRKRSLKRGGEFKITSASGEEPSPDDSVSPESLENLSSALDELASVDPQLAQLVDLHFFCGFTLVELAQMRGVSERTVQRDWRKARLLLHHALQGA